MEDTTMIGPLVHSLVHGETYQMVGAAEAIGRHGEGAIFAVAPLLRAVHRETRWRAAVALERIGPPSVEALALSAEDRDWRVRVPALWALGQIGDERSVPSLIQNLHGTNECCRWMAATALTHLGGEAIYPTMKEVAVANPFGDGVREKPIEGI